MLGRSRRALRVLATIAEAGCLDMRGIELRSGVVPAYTVVKKLEQAGLVEKRRVGNYVIVCITEEGRKAVEKTGKS